MKKPFTGEQIVLALRQEIHFRSLFLRSLSNLAALLRYNRFTCGDLWVWLNRPFEPTPVTIMYEP